MLTIVKSLISKKIIFYYCIVFLLFIIISFLEIIGLSTVPIVVEAFLNNDNDFANRLIKFLPMFEESFFLLNENTLKFILIFLLAIILIKNLILLITSYIYTKLNMRVLFEIRNTVFKKYLNLSYFEYRSINSTDSHNEVFQESEGAGNYVNSFFELLKEIIFLIFVVCALFYYDFVSTVLITSFLIILFFIFYVPFRKRIRDWSKSNQNLRYLLLKNLSQISNTFKEIKIFNSERFFFKRNLKSLEDIYSNDFKINFLRKIPKIYYEVILIIVIIGFLFFLLGRNDGNNISNILPDLAFYFIIMLRTMPIINNVLLLTTSLKQTSVSAERIIKLKKDLEGKKLSTDGKLKPTTNTLKKINSINIKNLSFKFEDSNEFIIKDLSKEINVGQVCGIYGPSGSGKSTLINLIIGFLTPSKGNINVNEKNIKEIDQTEWFSRLALLPQDQSIIDDTIINNIAYGIDEKEIDKKKIVNILNKIKLNFDDNKLSNFMVGDRGIKLSGGQKQKILAARALFRDRDIIFIDEPTNNLDESSCEMFMQLVNNIKFEKIIFIITHDNRLKKIFDTKIEFS